MILGIPLVAYALYVVFHIKGGSVSDAFIVMFIGGLGLALIVESLEQREKRKGSSSGNDSGSSDIPSYTPDQYQDFLQYEEKLKQSRPQGTNHAEWVQQDAEKHKKWAEEETRGWAEDYMDDHNW